MKRSVVTSARLHTDQSRAKGFRTPKTAMLTLTYRDDSEWQPRHVSALLDVIRKWLARRGVPFRYVWVLELTKRGRPHYHLMLWLPKGLKLPKADSHGWWRHGSTRIEWARNAVGYLAKYASKGTGPTPWKIPPGARLHGAGGFNETQRDERAWYLAPGWVRQVWADPALKPRPAQGGGWMALATGQWCPSPFLTTYDGKLRAVHVRPMSVMAFVGRHDELLQDVGLRELLHVVQSAGGVVRRLETVSEASGVTMVSPLHGSEDYWRDLATLYCKALSVDAFSREVREAEWDAFFADQRVRII